MHVVCPWGRLFRRETAVVDFTDAIGLPSHVLGLALLLSSSVAPLRKATPQLSGTICEVEAVWRRHAGAAPGAVPPVALTRLSPRPVRQNPARSEMALSLQAGGICLDLVAATARRMWPAPLGSTILWHILETDWTYD